MSQSLTIYRVAGDAGPALTVTDDGFDTTGWTITMRVTKPNGLEYTRPAVIDVVGDPGAGVPAEYHFDFVAGDLNAGDQAFDLHYEHATLDNFSEPADFKLTLRVRDQ